MEKAIARRFPDDRTLAHPAEEAADVRECPIGFGRVTAVSDPVERLDHLAPAADCGGAH